ncbi:SIS domain-containing protein [Methylacidiphilum caldifontis]|uniref:Phosphoheptose isomerase n=1 Tax=Methylacidiphilum caldifontis TaxID=2795386 RepID=A0A4Y8P9Z2_9BACT|nr:SIS domain-containing protein [Methylacidiphilum caldifontis]TFE67528.1 phosphoheptose isomerase [Methylacidiphilum caldifontis]
MKKELLWIKKRIEQRNQLFREFFQREAFSLAKASQKIAQQFLDGGKLLAFGKGQAISDAQHIAVEFVHPVIVGKRALPALDISLDFTHWLKVLCSSRDIVFGFSPLVEEDREVNEALKWASSIGAMTFSLPGKEGSYALCPPTLDPWIFQEMVEILYHTLWETVHLFFEHREFGYDLEHVSFLYPSLGQEKQQTQQLLEQVAYSIIAKANEDEILRKKIANEEAEKIEQAISLIQERIRKGGKLILIGNGGSATDANDFLLDLINPPVAHCSPIPAISLAMEPAVLSALANDVGVEVLFSRQLHAHSQPNDVVVALSTSGDSKNIVHALEEARQRGLFTVALLGNEGGEIVRKQLASVSIVVRSDYIPRIQEVQATVYHLLCEALVDPQPILELFGAKSCPFTSELREELTWQKKKFVEYDCETDTEALRRLFEITRSRSVPVLVENQKVISFGWQGRSCVV